MTSRNRDNILLGFCALIFLGCGQPSLPIAPRAADKPITASKTAPQPVATRQAPSIARMMARGVGIAKDAEGNIVALKFDLDHGNDFDEVIEYLTPQLDTVREVYCDWSDVSATGLAALARKCPNVRLIDLRNCVRLDGDDADDIRAFKNLQAVYVHWPDDTPGGTDSARENVQRFEAVLGKRVHADAQQIPGTWRGRLEFGP